MDRQWNRRCHRGSGRRLFSLVLLAAALAASRPAQAQVVRGEQPTTPALRKGGEAKRQEAQQQQQVVVAVETEEQQPPQWAFIPSPGYPQHEEPVPAWVGAKRLPVAVGTYDEALADAMVDFAGAAYYCRSSACESWACSACRRHPRFNATRIYDAKHNGNGFVGYDPDMDVVVVAFAGTDTRSTANWIDDLDGELTEYPWADPVNCKVHKGFLDTYKALRPQLLQQIKAVVKQHPRSPVWVTGHSLGAALGVLCTMDLLRQSYNVQASVNFGQPRVGNRELADYFHALVTRNKAAFFRLVHGQDPVPHLPPKSFGFWHPPTEVWYTKDETAHRICNDSGEDPHCSDKYILDTSVADHLHYLNVAFGAAELEGQLAELKMLAAEEEREGATVVV